MDNCLKTSANSNSKGGNRDMGAWRQEYERDWRGFTTRALANAFGAQDNALAVTQDDRTYLSQLLKSMGVHDHAAPRVPTYARASTRPRAANPNSTAETASYQETQLFDDLVSDEDIFGGGTDSESFRAAFNTSSMSNASYVYKTPQKRECASGCSRLHGSCDLTAYDLVHDDSLFQYT